MARVPINFNPEIKPETYTFTFGKYEGERFLDVLIKDAQYIVWCIENVRGFVVCRATEDAVYAEAEEQAEDNEIEELDFSS